jgi:hypothetical protein
MSTINKRQSVLAQTVFIYEVLVRLGNILTVTPAIRFQSKSQMAANQRSTGFQ